MKIMKKIFLAFGAFMAILVALTTSSCNDPSQLGADLFSNDAINLSFTDTLTLNAVTEPVDSIPVYTPTVGPYYGDMLLGNVNDATFGNTDARMYTQLRINGTIPDLSSTAVDTFGAYLELVYTAKRVYGDTTAPQTVTVRRLTDTITNQTIYSNQKLKTESTVLGSLTFVPKPNTTEPFIRVFKDDNGKETSRDTTYPAPRIRIPINKDFLRQISALDSTTKADRFTSWLKGLEIRVDNPTNCMMSFNLSTGSGLYVYYKKLTDTTLYTYQFLTSSVIRYTNFNLGYANAPIKPFLNNQVKGDSLLFVHGMAGADVKIEIPYLNNLGKVVINKAELELTVASNSQTETFPPIEQLTLKTAQYAPIRDLALDGAYLSTNPVYETLITAGGTVRTTTVNGETFKKYYLNVSGQLQQILNGKQGTIMYLTPHLKEQKASRVVVYGPKHSKYRAKLNVTYTKL